jgi:hypothetical protein
MRSAPRVPKRRRHSHLECVNAIVAATNSITKPVSRGVRECPVISETEIMGSKNPSRLLTRTTSQSDSTWVPQRTDENCAPTVRSTGADSPVTAPSLTEAAPSMTVPSAGMMSLASTSTRSPRCSVPASTMQYWFRLVPSSRFACVRPPIDPSLAAHALAHSTATASAKLANSTLNHSHAAISSMNVARHASPTIVVKMLPT